MKTIKRVLCIVFCFIFLFSFAACNKKTDVEEPTTEAPTQVTTTKKVIKYYNPLTGEEGLDPEYDGKRPIAVTIQNNTNGKCRPQWGLCDVDIVIEAEVEGMCTKYLYIIQDWSKLSKAGPFRSVRVDFVEMAMGFDAILCHLGWSEGVSYGAKESLQKSGYDHLNANGNAEIHKVDSVCPAGTKASNIYRKYTTGALITAYIDKINNDDKSSNDIRLETEESKSTPFSFFDEKTNLEGGACNSISFKVGSNNLTFTYKDGLYYGAYGSKEMTDSEKTPYAVSNVIVLYTKSVKKMDAKGRVDMDLSGGNGVVASNGTYQNITWKKGAADNSFKFYTEDGKEFKFNKGKSYIGIARQSTASKTTIA